jgi:hypothetical protein
MMPEVNKKGHDRTPSLRQLDSFNSVARNSFIINSVLKYWHRCQAAILTG